VLVEKRVQVSLPERTPHREVELQLPRAGRLRKRSQRESRIDAVEFEIGQGASEVKELARQPLGKEFVRRGAGRSGEAEVLDAFARQRESLRLGARRVVLEEGEVEKLEELVDAFARQRAGFEVRQHEPAQARGGLGVFA
jgi:hypothetical protein